MFLTLPRNREQIVNKAEIAAQGRVWDKDRRK